MPCGGPHTETPSCVLPTHVALMTASKVPSLLVSVTWEAYFLHHWYSLEVQARNVLGWPKSSFGFLCNRLWENPKELFGQVSMWNGILLKVESEHVTPVIKTFQIHILQTRMKSLLPEMNDLTSSELWALSSLVVRPCLSYSKSQESLWAGWQLSCAIWWGPLLGSCCDNIGYMKSLCFLTRLYLEKVYTLSRLAELLGFRVLQLYPRESIISLAFYYLPPWGLNRWHNNRIRNPRQTCRFDAFKPL